MSDPFKDLPEGVTVVSLDDPAAVHDAIANAVSEEILPVQKQAGYNSRVHFRLFEMPCCNVLICWVNSRTPNYCPECGERVYAKLKIGDNTHIDSPAWLRCDHG